MSDRDRMLFGAAAIGLIVCSLIWGVIGVGLLTRSQEHVAAERNVDSAGQRYQRETDESVSALIHEACASAREATPEDTQYGNKHDLCAQYVAAAGARRSANFTEGQTWIAIIGFAFVIVGLVLNYRATIAATVAAKAAESSTVAFMHAERPHLMIEELKMHGLGDALAKAEMFLASMEPQVVPAAMMVFRNFGKSPAMIENVVVKIIVGEPPSVPDYAVRKKKTSRREIIAPDKTFETGGFLDRESPLLTKSEVEEIRTESGNLRVVVMVEYADVFQVKHVNRFAQRYRLNQNITATERLLSDYWVPDGEPDYWEYT